MGSIGGGGAIGGGGGIGGGGDAGGEQQGKEDASVAVARQAVSEDLVWKARAVRAETRVGELEQRLSDIESELADLRSHAADAERRRELETELVLAEAVDVETAGVLVERMMSSDESIGVSDAVAQLKKTKPFLFRGPVRRSVMSGQVTSPARDVLGDLADEARSTGDRSALLRYLRARRGA